MKMKKHHKQLINNLNRNIQHILTECKTPLPELSAELNIPLDRLRELQHGNPQEDIDVAEFYHIFYHFSLDPDSLFEDTPQKIKQIDTTPLWHE